MKCADCKAEIMQSNPTLCPYCGSRNLVSNEEVMTDEAEILERAGRYEDVAEKYEELAMWDKAGDCRRMAKTNYVVSANINIGKVGSIAMDCPHCGASQLVATKSNEVTCEFCRKKYVIPKKVLDLL